MSAGTGDHRGLRDRGASVGRTGVRFRVADMDCPTCLRKIQAHLEKVEGVASVGGSPVARTLTVDLDPDRVSVEQVREEVGRLGYLAEHREDDGLPPLEAVSTWTSREALIAYASMGLFAVGFLVRFLGPTPTLFELPLHDVHLPDVFFLAAAAVGGWNFFPRGVRAARALALDMNFLMTVAILGAVGIGQYVEAAAIAFLFALAELLESYSVDRARASVESLMELAPDTARVERGGEVVTVSASDVAREDVVVVRPGERVPVDGRVVEGRSALDQSPITGESLPVEKVEGDEVYAGTINREGFLRVQATREAADSTLSRIIRLVEEAESRKAPSERFVERFARYYTPAVTVAAILVVAVPTLAFGAPFQTWFVRGLTLLVIACPCALVISTPVAVVSGITAAARNGVLIKGGSHLEALGGVRAVALDKTGTLTVGHLKVVEVRPADGAGEEEVLARAAAVEARSEHPVARAVVEAARDGRLASPWVVTDFQALPGVGARARLDGVLHAVGKPGIVNGSLAPPPDLATAGRTVVELGEDGALLGWIALSDRPRREAPRMVARLREVGIHHVSMLTGDNRATAEAVGRELGVDEVRAELLPAEKVRAVEELEERFGSVAMVGDGVNDGPALAVATVGVAMGAAGSDTALETADVALMGDDLSRLPYVHVLSRSARRVIRQNIAAAILVKAVLAVGVPLGMVSLITAVVVGDMGVSLAVTLNALRLGRLRPL